MAARGAVVARSLRRRPATPDMLMPTANADLLSRREAIAKDLRRLLSHDQVIVDAEARKAYESDGLTAYAQSPLLVVLPADAGQVSRVLRYCSAQSIPVVPRGAGTSLSGGALPAEDGIVLGLGKLNRILEIDVDNRCAVVQAGVTNVAVTRAVQHLGLYYAPDPSSQIACTVGGNIAENSGGVHCLKYGLTTNNVLGALLVLPDGEMVRLGGKQADSAGLDLLGVVVGSEGLLGIVAEATVRLLAAPSAARAALFGFASCAAAGDCVAEIIGAGIIPSGMEMMDRFAVRAAEEFVQAGYPLDVEALLIVELDGCEPEIAAGLDQVSRIAARTGAVYRRFSHDEAERMTIWAGRKAAFAAIGRLTPDYYCMDGTIPRRRLPEVLTRIEALARQYQLRVANVFHAGDGNLHPIICYDAARSGDFEHAEALGADILKLCVEVGGALTGEHGVGVEKRELMPIMFDEQDIAQQWLLKLAFDPQALLNPGKMFPLLHRCAEQGRVHVRGGQVRHAHLPRF